MKHVSNLCDSGDGEKTCIYYDNEAENCSVR